MEVAHSLASSNDTRPNTVQIKIKLGSGFGELEFLTLNSGPVTKKENIYNDII